MGAPREEVDPVCGVRVDPAKTAHKTVYGGRVYYFCCRHCKTLFERDPERYLERGSEGVPSDRSEGED